MSAGAAGRSPSLEVVCFYRAMRRVIAVAAVAGVAGCATQSADYSPRSATVGAQASVAPYQIDIGDSRWGSYLAGRYAHNMRDYDAASRYLVDALKGDSGNLDLLRRTFLVTLAARILFSRRK